jgi:hypothetical protein
LDDKGLLIEHIIGVEQIDPARTIMVGIVPTTCSLPPAMAFQPWEPSGAMAMPMNSGRLGRRFYAPRQTTSRRQFSIWSVSGTET